MQCARAVVAVAVSAVSWCALAGCGHGPKFYSVQGRVVFEHGDLQRLAGANVEFQNESDSRLRSYGAIRPDGSFKMETQYEGRFRPGVLEGTYQVRLFLVPPDDGDLARLARQLGLDPRCVDFQRSGWTVQVPTSDDLTLTLTRVGRKAGL